MARVTVYATPFCLYCVGAKAFLRRRGIPYDEVRINMFSDGARDRLQAESGGGRTFPQVVIDGAPIGGFPGANMTGGCTSSCIKFSYNASTQVFTKTSGSWTKRTGARASR